MPYLSLTVANFRNLKDSTIDFTSGKVFFVGENGQGKTNLLEALYLVAYGNSFREHTDSDLIKTGQKGFGIQAKYRGSGGDTTDITLTLDGGKKTILKDGKRILDRKELVDSVPTVLFSPDDMGFAIGEPERRRFFVDQTLSMCDKLYIDRLRSYRKVLRSRNMLLKDCKYDLLDVLDIQLAQEGLNIVSSRMSAIEEFNTLFTGLYSETAGIEGVSVAYLPSWKEAREASEVIRILGDKRQLDKDFCTTMSGPHRDRIVFVKEGRNFIKKASTGQRRLLALVLRIAQARFYSIRVKKPPVLLMDDVLLELDSLKKERFIYLLPEYDQLFCTFLLGEPYEHYMDTGTNVFNIRGGEWTV